MLSVCLFNFWDRVSSVAPMALHLWFSSLSLPHVEITGTYPCPVGTNSSEPCTPFLRNILWLPQRAHWFLGLLSFPGPGILSTSYVGSTPSIWVFLLIYWAVFYRKHWRELTGRKRKVLDLEKHISHFSTWKRCESDSRFVPTVSLHGDLAEVTCNHASPRWWFIGWK